MFLFKQVDDLQKFLEVKRNQGNIIGFVPTMGALHQGHLSLIEQSRKQADLTVCSIFVNPTQFNETEDLQNYPRTIAADIDLLVANQTGVLFLPPVEEVYPPGLETKLSLDFGDLATVMEGKFRPGHFDGMAQVVWRLLSIVGPDKLFMGQKDFQQFTIVGSMLKQLGSQIELIRCPIVREEDGLAMSSRNVRLSPEFRALAPRINAILQEAKALMKEKSPQELCEWGMKGLTQAGFKPEYFEIVDGMSLQKIESFKDAELVVCCTAVWAGEIRLIDNLIFKD